MAQLHTLDLSSYWHTIGLSLAQHQPPNKIRDSGAIAIAKAVSKLTHFNLLTLSGSNISNSVKQQLQTLLGQKLSMIQ